MNHLLLGRNDRGEVEGQKLLRGHSVVLIELKCPGQEIFDDWTEVSPGEDAIDLFRLDLLQKFFFVFGPPGSFSCQDFEEDDSNGPDICFVRILIPSQRFRSHVQRGSDVILAGLGDFIGADAEAEVCDFEEPVLRDEEIGRLEIAMDDFVFVDE